MPEPSPLLAWLRAVPWHVWPVLPYVLARALLDHRAAGARLREIASKETSDA